MKARKILLFLAALLMGSQAFAGAFCYSHHLHEAIQLNESRKPLYSQFSNGASEAISNKLIRMEKRLLLVSEPMDLWDLSLEKAGHSVLCDDFVSMDSASRRTVVRNQKAEPYSVFRPLDRENFVAEFKWAWKKGAMSALAVTQHAVAELDEHPDYNCMTRHILNSMARILYRTPLQMRNAGAIARTQIKWIANAMVKGHLDALKEVGKLDQMAAPIQAQGVPIICADVPGIPLDP